MKIYDETNYFTWRIHRLEVKVARNTQDIDDLKEFISSNYHHLEERVAHLEVKVEVLDEQMTALIELVNSMNVRLYTVEDEVNQIIHHS